MTDRSDAIYNVYRSSNILIGSTDERVYNFDTLEYWLACMGMMDTLIIMGIDARPWGSYVG